MRLAADESVDYLQDKFSVVTSAGLRIKKY
jgi:hypothetical protein